MFHSNVDNTEGAVPSEFDASTPVLVLGGKENSLSVVRNLSKKGISVACSGPSDCWGMNSRFCAARYPVPQRMEPKDYWFQLLLEPNSTQPRGQIILPGSDIALEFIAQHQEALSKIYKLDGGSTEQRRALLDKQTTLEMARDAGVGYPNFWHINSPADLEMIRDEINYPVMVKPRDSARFAREMGQKLFIVEAEFEELYAKVKQAVDAEHAVMVVEMIPGPDSLLSSYYTYMDTKGEPLFHFTKRIVRRYPVNRGNATFHATKWLPETAEAGLKFFRQTGFRGLGNIEFKLDQRDGALKIIEVNARFTAAEELAVKSGMPIDLIVYSHLTGQPNPPVAKYRENLNYLYFWRDLLAYLQLQKRGELSFRGWLMSIISVKSVSPLHMLTDPWPSIMAGVSLAKKALAR